MSGISQSVSLYHPKLISPINLINIVLACELQKFNFNFMVFQFSFTHFEPFWVIMCKLIDFMVISWCGVFILLMDTIKFEISDIKG